MRVISFCHYLHGPAAARKEMTLKADLAERGFREMTVAHDCGTVTAVLQEDLSTTEHEW